MVVVCKFHETGNSRRRGAGRPDDSGGSTGAGNNGCPGPNGTSFNGSRGSAPHPEPPPRNANCCKYDGAYDADTDAASNGRDTAPAGRRSAFPISSLTIRRKFSASLNGRGTADVGRRRRRDNRDTPNNTS